MLFGSPLLATTSRSGSASPDERNAASTSDECMTDLTRYGSRDGGFDFMGITSATFLIAKRREAYHEPISGCKMANITEYSALIGAICRRFRAPVSYCRA